MKIRTVIFMLVFACTAGLAVSAFAQTPRAQAEWSRYLSRHPELRRNPGLIFNQGYMKGHPDLNSFVLAHPNIQREVHRGNGSWDRTGAWRDPGWWHQNDPDWMYENHPEWANGNPSWGNDGVWDDQHRWHDRDWWVDTHRDWVEHHHPAWIREEPPGWAKHHHDNDGDYSEGEDHDEGHGHGHAYGHHHGHGHDND